MATFNVSTAAQLSAALASAHAGDTILLASGTYSGLVLKNVHFSSAVTITSADLAHPATITDLIVNSCSGLTFSNLEVDESSSTVTNPFQILSSSNIQLSHLWIHGSLDNNPSDDPAGLFIRNSDHITVSGCEFEQLWHGAGFLDSNYLQFTGNSFHDIRSDGIRGGGSSFVTISDNSFTDFFPNFAAGDHPDAIQFWTTNTTSSAHDITITDNVISRGTGAAVQGIFLRDQVGNLPYENVSITGNMLVGTAFNGIFVDHASGVTLSGDVVAGYPDEKSWIRLEEVSGAQVAHDTAAALLETSDTNVSVTDFTDLLPSISQANDLLQTWLSQHPDVASVLDGHDVGIETVGTSTGPIGGTTDSGGGSTTGGTDGTTGGTTTGGTTTGGTTTGGTTTGGTTTGGTTTGGTTTGGTATGTGNTEGDSRHFPTGETKIPIPQVAAGDSVALVPTSDQATVMPNTAHSSSTGPFSSTSDEFVFNSKNLNSPTGPQSAHASAAEMPQPVATAASQPSDMAIHQGGFDMPFLSHDLQSLHQIHVDQLFS